MRKLIIILVVLAVLVTPGIGITVEYFSNPPEETHQGFTRPSDIYIDNADMFEDVEALAGGNATWVNMTDAEKVWVMTKFVRQHGLKCKPDKAGDHDVTPSTAYEKINGMTNNEYGFMCLGHALILTAMCNVTGIEAYSISAGDLVVPWTHAVTIAKCTVDGHEKFVMFDPYFGDFYVYENLTPMSFFQMQDYINATEYSSIYRRSIGYKYDIHTLTNSSYDYNAGAGGSAVTGNMYHTLVETNVGEDYRLWRNNNWFITPYCVATESAWSTVYTNPYEVFTEVYSCLDAGLNEVNIADVEAEET